MLKTFDYQCNTCSYTKIDAIVEAEQKTLPCLLCGGTLERTWGLMSKSSSVVGDECDIVIKHGICNLDGTPRRYRSKAEMARVAKERGLVNRVEHRGTKGGDKNRNTQRWI